jgi:hypothetical protein
VTWSAAQTPKGAIEAKRGKKNCLQVAPAQEYPA